MADPVSSAADRNPAAHWPEYLIEAWALGMFMISAGVFTLLLESPASPLHAAIPDAFLRRLLTGAAMGLTAIALIYSPWGRRSGAHMNPAVTLSFLRLRKIAPSDAAFYIFAQFIGGTLGVCGVLVAFGPAFSAPPVSYVATVPGSAGVGAAFTAEIGISALMIFVVLMVSSSAHLARFTGLCAGLLVCLFISFEGPLSGMSINPARSFASALPGAYLDLILDLSDCAGDRHATGDRRVPRPAALIVGSLCQIASHHGRALHSLRLRAHPALNGRQQ